MNKTSLLYYLASNRNTKKRNYITWLVIGIQKKEPYYLASNMVPFFNVNFFNAFFNVNFFNAFFLM